MPNGLFARAELSLKGKESLNSGGVSVQLPMQTIELRAGYEAPWSSTRAFVDNLTDVRRSCGLAFRKLGIGDDGNCYAPVSRERQVGVEPG